MRDDRLVVYALVDPRSGVARYIGATMDLRARVRTHWGAAASPCSGWARDLRDAGYRGFVVVELAEVRTFRRLRAEERQWIAYARANGWPLLNGPKDQGGTVISSIQETHFFQRRARARRVA